MTIPDYRTIEDIQSDLIASVLIFGIQTIFLLMNLEWVLTDLKVELAHSGAWDPWLSMGVAFYLLMFVEVIYYCYKLYSCRVQDPLRR